MKITLDFDEWGIGNGTTVDEGGTARCLPARLSAAAELTIR